MRYIIFFIICFINFAHGQSITEQIRAEGKSIDVGKSLSRWQPLWEAADNSAVKVTYDLKYGPDKKQGFDLYEPVSAPSHPSPILVFYMGVHLLRVIKPCMPMLGIILPRWVLLQL
ncbi:MAG: hypothetical protein P8O77_07835 [Emcibacteraceae bacterium]|nr:hypothetical protein [Emcibacteraceae bacterium]